MFRMVGLIVAAFLVTGATGFAVQTEDAARDLIQRAGNADDDSERLALLKELRQLPGLDDSLKADADKLITEIDQWLHEKRLPYFGRPVREALDYDFKIAEESPLYPLTYLYRGRMLVWYTLESGGIWNNQPNRRRFLDKARGFFERARDAFPENRIARMYLGEAIPPHKEYSGVAGAPEWAVYQRASLERLADIIEWWIDNRMQPNGEYGGGWGDDCEMWRWWVPVLIAFDEPRISAAQARFSEALMSQSHMKKGYTSHVYDVEHTAEDSSDVMTPMMHIDPDNEVWVRRALRLAELMETLWTGVNDRGFLQFKSTYFSADKVDEDPHRACDTVYHPRAVQPALLYWQRTGDDRLGRLFTAWLDTWVNAAARAERGKPAGIIPSALHWPDGDIGGVGEDWWDPRNHGEATLYEWPSALSLMTHSLLLAHHMTKDPKYMRPIRSMAAIRLKYLKNPPEETPAPGTESWCARQLGGLRSVVAKYKLLCGSDEFDELLAKERDPYMGLRMRRDRRGITSALQNTATALQFNFEGYTSEVRYTDRVLRFPSLFRPGAMFPEGVAGFSSPDTSLLYSTATGDPGGAGYCPLNAVRWLTPPRNIAALVTDSGSETFRAEMFHFGEEPRAVSAEFYLLEPGEYVLSLAPEGTTAPATQQNFIVTGQRTRVDFKLPPQTLCEVSVHRRLEER